MMNTAHDGANEPCSCSCKFLVAAVMQQLNPWSRGHRATIDIVLTGSDVPQRAGTEQ
jgi:hypothetical protein